MSDATTTVPPQARRKPRLTLIDVYLVSEVLPMFAAGLLVVVVLLVLGALYEVAAPIIAKGANPLLVAKFLAFKMPEAFSRGMPIALLFAVLLSLSRLTQDSELKAMIVNGVAPSRLAVPVLAVGALVAALAFVNAEALVPRGNQRALATMKDIILANPRVLVQPGQFFTDGQGQAIYVRQLLENRQIRDVTVIQTASGQVPRSLTQAPRGQILPDEGAIELLDGTRITYRPGDARPVTVLRFKHALIPIRDLQEGSQVSQLPIYLPIPELVSRIREYHRLNQPAYAEETALHRKFAEPAAAIAFALFGVAIALFTLRANQNLGFVGVMFLTFFYYATWSVFRVMGENGALWPPLAAWGPDLVYAGAGFVLLWAAWRR